MNIYTIEFTGHYLTGSAVIVATHRTSAAMLLERKLKQIGLQQQINPTSLVKLELDKAQVIILQDGDY